MQNLAALMRFLVEVQVEQLLPNIPKAKTAHLLRHGVDHSELLRAVVQVFLVPNLQLY
jgi:hypothetical protein